MEAKQAVNFSKKKKKTAHLRYNKSSVNENGAEHKQRQQDLKTSYNNIVKIRNSLKTQRNLEDGKIIRVISSQC